MDKITKDQLSQMLERAGLDPSRVDLGHLVPMVRELGQLLKVLRSANSPRRRLAAYSAPIGLLIKEASWRAILLNSFVT